MDTKPRDKTPSRSLFFFDVSIPAVAVRVGGRVFATGTPACLARLALKEYPMTAGGDEKIPNPHPLFLTALSSSLVRWCGGPRPSPPLDCYGDIFGSNKEPHHPITQPSLTHDDDQHDDDDEEEG
jgi:hypothetical protein